MTDTALKTPWHLWAAGVIGILWYLNGGYDFSSTILREPSYTAYFSQETHDFYDAMPWWAITAWGAAEVFGIAGGILLLLKSRFAMHAFVAATISIFINLIYNFVLADAGKALGPTAIYFEAFVITSTILFLVYAYWMRTRGVIH